MNSRIAIRLVVLGAVVTGVVGGGILGLLLVTRGTTTTESAIAILQKSGATQSEALASLGPNTTLHAKGVTYAEQTPEEQNAPAFARPDTTVGESFWTFDADGKLSAYSSTTTGLDGQLYQHTEMVGDDWVTTDVKSGETSVLPNARQGATLDYTRGAWSRAVTPLVAALGPANQATKTTIDGTDAFVIETPPRGMDGIYHRVYIGQADYSLLQSESVAPDGRITGYTKPTVLEVLPAAPATPTATPSP